MNGLAALSDSEPQALCWASPQLLPVTEHDLSAVFVVLKPFGAFIMQISEK